MLKENEIYLGDILEKIKEIDDKSIDCIITSPPYWKGFEYEAYFNSYQQYMNWSHEWISECKRVLKDDGTFWLNVANDSETTVKAFELLNICTNDVMFKLHDTIIWYCYNRQPSNSNRQLTNQTEFIFMLKKTSDGTILNKESAYQNAPDMFKTKNVGNVWELSFNDGNKEKFAKKELQCKWGHSGFPLKLPETCILLSTKENDLVLDPFSGSGTTCVAAKKHNRKYIGIDNQEKYVIQSKNRLLPF